MSFDTDQLYNLLPAVHRLRDSEVGAARAREIGFPESAGETLRPLRQLIEVIAGQVAVVEESLEQLYDNQFVETAAPWALPYLGDLLGIRGLSGAGALTRAPRAEVGHTIAYRRRKGTAAMLELLARDVTGWPARAVEFFERLASTQHLNHLRPANHAFPELRDADAQEFFATPFERATRTVEVRRIAPGRGKWNIPNVGVFLWRLRAYPFTRSPLKAAALAGNRHFRFHPLGLDAPLFTRPDTEDDVVHLATPLNVPMPISVRMLVGEPWTAVPQQFHPSVDYYGAGRSLKLERRAVTGPVMIPPADVLVCDLGDVHQNDNLSLPIVAWAHEQFGSDHGKILLDPARGRVVFPQAQDPARPPLASFHHGLSDDIGGGEYDRSGAFDAQAGVAVKVANVRAGAPGEFEPTLLGGLNRVPSTGGFVEIADSGRYGETGLQLIDATAREVEIRSANGTRAVIVLGNELIVKGDANGTVTLNGLLVCGRRIRVQGPLGKLRLRHCSLVPDLTVRDDGTAARSGAAALIVESDETEVEIENCIVHGLRVNTFTRVRLENSVVDAGDPAFAALADQSGTGNAGAWRIANCTIVGGVLVRSLELASNTIFLAAPGGVNVTQRQEGCVRFSFVPPDSRTPRRHECVPRDGAAAVRPGFTSLRYGDPGYAQLGRFCPDAILRGADDESEIGVFHDLHQPQREAHLRTRLDEYLRFGLEAGVFFVT